MFRGKIVLGYTEAELRVRGSGYQFIHAADMLYCAENHVRSKSQLLSLCPATHTAQFILNEARLSLKVTGAKAWDGNVVSFNARFSLFYFKV